MTRRDTHLGKIELANGIYLETYQQYLEQSGGEPLADDAILTALRTLQQAGAKAIVAATAFSVDDPQVESRIVELASSLGLPATATHEISQLYGLKARTRTAAVNAAILPKMIDTGFKTNEAVKAMKINAPLVVMRSDGGAMAIDEMKRRPVLTLLSGPAAGVAAALMAARIADGIFLEVGGTSTDISCIVNGRPSVKMASIGGHKLYLNTIDVRTLGVAGGSLPGFQDRKLVSVGPRSAHIAGLKYSAFAGEPGPDDEGELQPVRAEGQGISYLAMNTDDGRLTATTTCAANILGLIPAGDYAAGNQTAIAWVMGKMAVYLGLSSATELATRIMEKGSFPIINTIKELISENKVGTEMLSLVGGGGGASVWLNYVSQKLNIPANLVEYAPVISAIGAAMALLQETIERTIIDPKPEDFTAIRQQVETALLKSGADPRTLEVRVEVDSQRGILRAVATGAHQMSVAEDNVTEEELFSRANEMLGADRKQQTTRIQTAGFVLFQAEVVRKKLWGLMQKKSQPWVVFDKRGRVRLSSPNGTLRQTSVIDLQKTLNELIDLKATYGDAGLVLPHFFIVSDSKIVDLSGLSSREQLLALCQEEQCRLLPEDTVLVLSKN